MKKPLFFIGFFIVITSCVSEFDFSPERTQFIIISGVISNNPSERSIKMIEHIPTHGRINGKLFKNGGLETHLEFWDFRELGLPDDIVIEAGASYHIEITSDDGEVFQSKPQVIQLPYKIAGLRTEISPKEIKGQNGNIRQGYGVNVIAQINVLEAQQEPIYLRFHMGESWAFREIDDPRIEGDTIYTCYFIRDNHDFIPQIWTNHGRVSGLNEVFVADREIDESFMYRHYFNVYSYRITRDAFEYYKKAKSLSKRSGLLIDEIPAPIEGNIFSLSGEKLVYGLVEFALVDTTHIYMDSVEISVAIPLACNEPNPCPPPPEDANQPLDPCPCADCLLLGARYERPDYFK